MVTVTNAREDIAGARGKTQAPYLRNIIENEIDKFTVSNIKQELTEDKRKKRRLRYAEVEPTAWL